MDPVDIRLIRKVVIKERRAEEFRKICPPTNLREPFKVLVKRLLVLELTVMPNLDVSRQPFNMTFARIFGRRFFFVNQINLRLRLIL
jgi:hypothetical protein